MIGASKKALATELAAIDQLAAVPLQGSPVITVLAPKGGGAQTTTTTGILAMLANRIVGMLVADDFNPEKTTLTWSLGIPQSLVPRRFIDLARNPEQIIHPANWAPFLDRAGRIHVLHNDDVLLRAIATITLDQYRTLLAVQRRFAAMTVIDAGTSLVHPACIAAIEAADHLVITTTTAPRALGVTASAIGELAGTGFGSLVREATVVISQTVPRLPADRWIDGYAFFKDRVRNVVNVPFDRKLSVDAIDWAAVSTETAAAQARITRLAVEAVLRRYASPQPETPTPAQNWPTTIQSDDLTRGGWVPLGFAIEESVLEEFPAAPPAATAAPLPSWATPAGDR